MVEADLDRRIREAAAAVETLRRESLKLDEQLRARHLGAFDVGRPYEDVVFTRINMPATPDTAPARTEPLPSLLGSFGPPPPPDVVIFPEAPFHAADAASSLEQALHGLRRERLHEAEPAGQAEHAGQARQEPRSIGQAHERMEAATSCTHAGLPDEASVDAASTAASAAAAAPTDSNSPRPPPSPTHQAADLTAWAKHGEKARQEPRTFDPLHQHSEAASSHAAAELPEEASGSASLLRPASTPSVAAAAFVAPACGGVHGPRTSDQLHQHAEAATSHAAMEAPEEASGPASPALASTPGVAAAGFVAPACSNSPRGAPPQSPAHQATELAASVGSAGVEEEEGGGGAAFRAQAGQAAATGYVPEPPAGPPPTARAPRPSPASRVARPRQAEKALAASAADFPSEAAVATMSRRERIALLERQEVGNHPELRSAAPREHSASRARPTAAGLATKALARGTAQPAEAAGFPSEAAVGQMSRRERIALLEGGGGYGGSDVAPLPRLTSRRRELSAPTARRHVAAARAAPEDTAEELPALGEAEWQELEQRRLKRKQRLQQRATDRAAAAASAVRQADQLADRHVEEASAAVMPRRAAGTGGAERAMRRESPPLGDAGVTATTVAAASEQENPALASGAEPVGPGGRTLLEQMEDAVDLGVGGPAWPAACSAFAASAHKLSSGALVRAVEVLATAAAAMPAVTGGKDEPAALPESPPPQAFHAASETLLACITPQLASLGVCLIANLLHIMAAARVEEQTYLDMLLAQLLVLARRDRAGFTPSMLANIASALGALHEAGLSAKRAASGPSSAANRRCVDTLGELITSSLGHFEEADIAEAGGSFVVTFLDDAQRRAMLQRAAELEVGLRESSQAHLPAMCSLERAVRQHSFAFVAGLPDQTKDYLVKLKASTGSAAGP